jgi:hypothetical protein
MMDEAEDRALVERIPFVRGAPSTELWQRIEADARAVRRSRRIVTWGARVAALAAGALAWLAVDLLLRRADAPSTSRGTVARDERAWLRDATDELPPEARLAAYLVAQEDHGR